MYYRLSVLLALAALLWVGPLSAQTPSPNSPLDGGEASPRLGPYESAPEAYTIGSIRVEGVESDRMRDFVLEQSGLAEGQEVMMPGGEAIAQAIRSLYGQRLFSDVEIYRENTSGNTANLVIRVESEPVLVDYSFQGIERKHRDDLEEEIPLLRGRPAQPSEIKRSQQIIKDFYADQGYLQTEVQVHRTTTSDNQLQLTFYVDRGRKAEVESIRFTGNEALSDGSLRGAMETKEDRWWRFWKGEKLDRETFEEDLERVVDYYNERGYYDARVVSDSVYLADGGVVAEVEVHEGPRYHIRSVDWEGNTVYPDRVLTETLGLREGDVYNGKKLEENIYGSQRGTDVLGLYQNRGYLRANVEPTIRAVEGDSLDLIFDVRENDIYEFGDIRIAGNTKTKEHVIRRELYTVPGNTFSRDAIQESIRRLMQLNYFSQESLQQGPGVSIDEERQKVDLAYEVEEVGSDQLELSGTYGQFGLVLQLRFTFNNFSAQNLFNWDAYRPLPSGDGQELSLGVQTNGTYYQNYSISFTEPWFRGRPTPIGGSLSYQFLSCLPYGRSGRRSCRDNDNSFEQISSRFFYQQRLQWPDDMFSTSSAVSYQRFANDSLYSPQRVPIGVNNQVSFEQSLSRNSLDNPLFPTSGSKVELSLELAPPIGDLVQYHKWRFKTGWNVPLLGKLSLNFSTDYGYVGSLTGEEPRFGRFDVGGSPFDYGRYTYGNEPVFMRGYPASSLNPRSRNEAGNLIPVDGRILTKYASELRLLAVQTQQLQAAPYLFLDAGNTWASFDTFNPGQLYRAAGVGARLYLPIVGMIEINYGYNFDRYLDMDTGRLSPRDWTFQISLGQSFGQ